MLDPVKNFAIVVVSTGYDDTATSVVLTSGDGAKLPDPSTDGEFNLVWWNSEDFGDPPSDTNVEIVRVTAKSTDTLTITRGQEDTSASSKNEAGKTYKMILTPTKKTIEDIKNWLANKQDILSEGAFVDGDKTKLDGIEALADVTDSANVKSALSGETLTGSLTTADHGIATNPEVVSVVYGTGTPPTASGTPEGTLFIEYVA